MTDTTPREIGRLRNKIIEAMLAGKISYFEAMRLQEMQGNIELTMACKRSGIEVDTKTEEASG